MCNIFIKDDKNAFSPSNQIANIDYQSILIRTIAVLSIERLQGSFNCFAFETSAKKNREKQNSKKDFPDICHVPFSRVRVQQKFTQETITDVLDFHLLEMPRISRHPTKVIEKG